MVTYFHGRENKSNYGPHPCPHPRPHPHPCPRPNPNPHTHTLTQKSPLCSLHSIGNGHVRVKLQSAESSDEESSRSLLTIEILDSDGEVIEVHHCEWTVGSDDTPIDLTDSDILEVWVGEKSLDLDQNFVPPSERGIIGQVVNATLLDDQWEDMSDDDDISFPDSNSFDSYNHKNSFSPDNTNYYEDEDEEEQEVR